MYDNIVVNLYLLCGCCVFMFALAIPWWAWNADFCVTHVLCATVHCSICKKLLCINVCDYVPTQIRRYPYITHSFMHTIIYLQCAQARCVVLRGANKANARGSRASRAYAESRAHEGRPPIIARAPIRGAPTLNAYIVCFYQHIHEQHRHHTLFRTVSLTLYNVHLDILFLFPISSEKRALKMGCTQRTAILMCRILTVITGYFVTHSSTMSL